MRSQFIEILRGCGGLAPPRVINDPNGQSFPVVAKLQLLLCHVSVNAKGRLKPRRQGFNAKDGGPPLNSLRQDDSRSFLPDEQPPSFFFLEPCAAY
jgi:hypothetical protein